MGWFRDGNLFGSGDFFLRPVFEKLIGQDADEDDGAEYGEVERTGNVQEVDEILQDLQQCDSN